MDHLRWLDVQLWAEGDRLRYSAPKGTLTPSLRAELAEQKTEILAILDNGILATNSTSLPLQPISRDGELPLSFIQERLWFLEQLDPVASTAYNIPVALRITGPLNVAALHQTFNEIVRRHEGLRATCSTVNGQPIQTIASALNLTLPVVDLRELPGNEREAEVLRLAHEEALRPFDLPRGPLLRAALLRLGGKEHMLLLTTHHFVADGWSMRVLFREVSVLFKAFSTGSSSPLPELPIQYADFAHWQRQWIQGEVLETQLAYWKKQLAGAPTLQELPTDRRRPAVQTYVGAARSFELPVDLSEEIRALSRREGVTLFMTLLAAFQTLLHRYTRKDDIIVGTAASTRNRIETEELIGTFANNLVLRTDFSGNPAFRELLARVREVALGAYAHQDLPFEKLVEELKPRRGMSHTPLFQVVFVLHQTTLEQNLKLPGLTLSPLEVDLGTTRFDLTLSIIEGAESLRGWIQYNTDLFEEATIKRLARNYETILEGIVADPEQRLSELPLLGAAERHQLLVEWNNTQVDYADLRSIKDSAIHILFERQVERTPDAIVVVFEDARLTYRELNTRANQLAHHLQKLGVGPEVLVGICLERSLEMMIGILGILKAGGAYVPLDPSYPKERLTFMLDDIKASVVVTQQRLAEALPEHKAHLVCLDKDWKAFSHESQENPVSGVTADNLAYSIYTSGTTGKPKGVLVEHKQVLNYVKSIQDRLELRPAASFAMVQPLAFDLCVTVIYPPLFTGGCLHVISEQRAADAHALGDYFRRYPIDCLKIAPSHLAALQSSSHPEQILPRRWLIIGGEASRWDWVRKLERMGACSIFNHYGPTEATVGVLTYRVERAQTNSNYSTTPIGRPLPNTQIYLLDRHLQPVPIGAPGELYIGGRCVARGYLNLPELTAEKFIPNRFSSETGARLYKTGDLARYLPDGNIEFLGRGDHQIKIRGFRVELGEIEIALGRHPAIAETVVLASEDEAGHKRLVAYFVVEGRHSPTTGELRGFLKEKLPDYMVPSAFVMLDTMPLTPHGKVDRRALPVTSNTRPQLEDPFVPPCTPAEELLTEIWTQVLGVEQVGVHDNFFELGGDSILSIQIITKANQAGLLLTPKQLFQHQTVAQLAALAGTTPLIQAEQGLVTGNVPLTPIQHKFIERELPDPHHWNMALLLEVMGSMNSALLGNVVQHLLIHHDALRLRLDRERFGWQQINAGSEEKSVFSQIDISEASEEEQEATFSSVAEELQAGLNLSEGPLLQVALFTFGTHRPNRLLIVIHHLAVDGVSWRILLEDFQTAYSQLSRGEEIQLPAKTTSFKSWAQRLRVYAQSEELRPELDYWLKRPWARHSPLPVDRPGGANTEASARTVSVSLSIEETRALLQEVPKAYHTQINDLLLTALVQAFSQWTGAQSLLINLEGHGREEIVEDVDFSRTVGWFTTHFPVLLDLGETSEPGSALKAIKEQLRCIPHKGIGFGLLRYLSEDAEIAGKLGGLPRPEVSFNYLGQFDHVLHKSSLFRLVREPSGQTRSPSGNRLHLLEVNGIIAEDMLHLNWTYSENVHKRAIVERLAQGLIEALKSLVAHCRSRRQEAIHPQISRISS